MHPSDDYEIVGWNVVAAATFDTIIISISSAGSTRDGGRQAVRGRVDGWECEGKTVEISLFPKRLFAQLFACGLFANEQRNSTVPFRFIIIIIHTLPFQSEHFRDHLPRISGARTFGE